MPPKKDKSKPARRPAPESSGVTAEARFPGPEPSVPILTMADGRRLSIFQYPCLIKAATDALGLGDFCPPSVRGAAERFLLGELTGGPPPAPPRAQGPADTKGTCCKTGACEPPARPGSDEARAEGEQA